MVKNEKDLDIIWYTLFLVIMIGAILIWGTLQDEQKYCQKNPEDCECAKTCNNYLEELEGHELNKKFWEICIKMEGRWEYIDHEECYEYKKKNPCQLKLEEEGILGEDCVCEESKKAYKIVLDCQIIEHLFLSGVSSEYYYCFQDEEEVKEYIKIEEGKEHWRGYESKCVFTYERVENMDNWKCNEEFCLKAREKNE